MIDRVESFSSSFTEQDVTGLLCMPQVLVDLLEACLDGESSQSLTDIVLRDAALAAQVILIASKTSPKLLEPTEPVSSAIQIIGIPRLTGVALQAARRVVQHKFSPTELIFQHRLWFTSQIAGLTARCLAPSVNYPHIEEAQLGGLWLNLGIHALFAREGSGYVDLDVNAWSSTIQSQLEEAHYQTDHLQIADKLIGLWQLDSFLADSIRFLHADIAQIEKSSPLLKIARLTQQLCQKPQQLTADNEMLAQRLFDFSKSETDHLFNWVIELYPPFGSILNDPEKVSGAMSAALEQLTELSFTFAAREAIRARLSSGKSLEDLVAIVRGLYLENSSTVEAIFFLLDHKSQLLTGIAGAGQPFLIGELNIPITVESSLVSAAVHNLLAGDSLQSQQPLTVTDQLLIRLCKGSGICCQPLHLEGQALGVVVLGINSAEDLSQLQSLHVRMFETLISAAVQQLTAAAPELFADSNSLLRRVSHEVNNPLTIIGNYAEVLNHQLTDSASLGLTKTIKDEVRRVDNIINYYLQRQEIPGFPEYSVDLNRLVLDMVATLEEVEFKPRQIRMQLNLQKQLDSVATNPVLVKQILVNLLKNSVEAVSDGGLLQLITRDGYSADGGSHVEIIVQDNGPGIAPALQKKLFQTLISTKGAGHAGVGLSIVKEMVGDLGGRISCHSSVESGTSFYLQIPRREDLP